MKCFFIFAFWWFLSDISATCGWIHTKLYTCRDNVCRRAPSLSGVHRPLGGRVEGELKLKKIGCGVIHAVDSYYFYFSQVLPNVVQYVGQRPAHILV